MAKPKTVSLRVNVSANAQTRMIHLASNEAGLISMISNDPESKRYHPNLFKKLRRVLVDRGKWPE